MTRRDRLVTAAFLGAEDLAALERRPAHLRPGTWLLRLVREDARESGVWRGPRPHVAKAESLGRIVVSLRPEDEVKARRRCGDSELSAYLRGLLRHGPGAPSHPETLNQEDPMKLTRRKTEAKKTTHTKAGQERPRRRVFAKVRERRYVEWAVLESLVEERSPWPPVSCIPAVGWETADQLESTVLGLQSARSVRLIFGVPGKQRGDRPSRD